MNNSIIILMFIKSKLYNETQVRREFIDTVFEARKQ